MDCCLNVAFRGFSQRWVSNTERYDSFVPNFSLTPSILRRIQTKVLSPARQRSLATRRRRKASQIRLQSSQSLHRSRKLPFLRNPRPHRRKFHRSSKRRSRRNMPRLTRHGKYCVCQQVTQIRGGSSCYWLLQTMRNTRLFILL
jgi:hypothetical protein